MGVSANEHTSHADILMSVRWMTHPLQDRLHGLDLDKRLKRHWMRPYFAMPLQTSLGAPAKKISAELQAMLAWKLMY